MRQSCAFHQPQLWGKIICLVYCRERTFHSGKVISSFKGQFHVMDIFFEGRNILIRTFCVSADGFQGLSKAFNCPIQLLTFNLVLWNYLLNFKMLTETSSEFPSVIGRCLKYRPLIGYRENAQELTCHMRLPVWFYFIESKAAFCKRFQCQNGRFRFFEAGYWNDCFQN